MKVLLVCSAPSEDKISSFTRQHANTLNSLGVKTEFYLIKGKGVKGYTDSASKLKDYLKTSDADLVHAIYGLSGAVASIQNIKPVVVSFIGCDINIFWQRQLAKSYILKRAQSFIFVSKKLKEIAGNPENSYVIPFGIDLNIFYPLNKAESRKKLNWDINKKCVLFASNFQRIEKNSELAFKACNLLKEKVELIEMKDIPNEQLPVYYSACDVLLLTSIREGSPQVIKEALACNTPIVSTDVGDVKEITSDIPGCYITSFEPDDVASKIELALNFHDKDNLKKNLSEVDSTVLTKRVISVYEKTLQIKGKRVWNETAYPNREVSRT